MSDSPPNPMRVMPPTILLVCLLVMFALKRFWPIVVLWRPPHSFGGLLPIFVGFGLSMYSAYLFRRHQTTIKPYEESATLITYGPYAYSRNPMYLGMTLLLVGCATLFGVASVWVVPPAFAYIIQERFIKPEESQLAEKFGHSYQEYRRRVRRWL